MIPPAVSPVISTAYPVGVAAQYSDSTNPACLVPVAPGVTASTQILAAAIVGTPPYGPGIALDGTSSSLMRGEVARLFSMESILGR